MIGNTKYYLYRKSRFIFVYNFFLFEIRIRFVAQKYSLKYFIIIHIIKVNKYFNIVLVKYFNGRLKNYINLSVTILPSIFLSTVPTGNY